MDLIDQAPDNSSSGIVGMRIQKSKGNISI